MNIFYTDSNSEIAAQNLCDVHVCKMLIESAQMLSTAHFVHGSWTQDMYKPTHKNHPSTIWTRTSQLQYGWLFNHFLDLCAEYTHRYGKAHKSERLIPILQYSPTMFRSFEPPPQCMPNEYKISDNTVSAYRKYYISKQLTMKRKMKWTNRKEPEWFQRLELNG